MIFVHFCSLQCCLLGQLYLVALMATTLVSGHGEVVVEEEEMASSCYLSRTEVEGEGEEEGKEERFLGLQCCRACLLQEEKSFLVLQFY